MVNIEDAQSYESLDARKHLLKRPYMYIGSIDVTDEQTYIFKNGKAEQAKIKNIPGIVKIINEIIDNSVDVYVKTDGRYGNKISVQIDKDFTVTVKDNGTGIPVEENKQGKLIPKMCFGESMAGSNFKDEKRIQAGMNGVGAYACNVFSKIFKVVTIDHKDRRYTAIWHNNGILHDEKFGRKNHDTRGTTVEFTIDIDKFNIGQNISLEELYENTSLLIKQRLYNIAALHPKLQFTFNGEVIKFKNVDEFVKQFGEEYTLIQTQKYFVAFLTSDTDDFQFHSYVNGLHLKKGGEHIDMITDEVVKRLRAKLGKRYKNIKSGDIKNKLFIIAFFKDFENFKNDGQTKEILKNSRAEIREYLGDTWVWDKIVDKIYKSNKLLIEEILLRYKVSQEVNIQRELKKAQKNQNNLPTGYWPATKEKKYFTISEGDSAINSIIIAIGRENMGFLGLKGVIVNVLKNIKKIASNAEIKDISNILNISLSDIDQNEILEYEEILIATDADQDGAYIAALLMGFFYKFAPKYFKEGKIKRFKTPIMMIKNSKEEVLEIILDYRDMKKIIAKYKDKNVEYDYKKGLGSLNKKEWKQLFKKHTVEELAEVITFEDYQKETEELKRWLLEDSEFRKRKIDTLLPEFDINSL